MHIRKYEVFNPENKNCHLCNLLRETYNTNALQTNIKIPGSIGRGYSQRIRVGNLTEITITDMTLNQKMTMSGGPCYPSYCLAFSLGDTLEWWVEENKKEYYLVGGEGYIFNGIYGNGICSYQPDKQFLGVNIQLDSKIIMSFMDYIKKDDSYLQGIYGCNRFYKMRYSARVRMILYDIIHCNYQNDIKKIYLEGKTLELIAVLLNELADKSEDLSPQFSLTDRQSLDQAKQIVDANITAPPTIGELSKMVALNEYKLKQGFKALYKMPVHTYIIDKRLELARCLIEDKGLRVTEAAQLVGYSDASHFAQKFRKKYGINPSQYNHH